MVDQKEIFDIATELEYYLLKLNEYKFNGKGYSLVLFVPILRGEDKFKFNIILSAPTFDSFSRKELISDIYDWLENRIEKVLFDKVESIIIVNSHSPFVKNLNFVINIKEEIRELGPMDIGGIKINSGILINLNIVNGLKPNNALIVTLNDGSTINMGILSIDDNLIIKYYTGKGLRELFPKAVAGNEEKLIEAKNIIEKGEDYLYENGYLDYRNLLQIRSIK